MYKVDCYMVNRKDPLELYVTDEEFEAFDLSKEGWLVWQGVLINKSNIDAVVTEKLE